MRGVSRKSFRRKTPHTLPLVHGLAPSFNGDLARGTRGHLAHGRFFGRCFGRVAAALADRRAAYDRGAHNFLWMMQRLCRIEDGGGPHGILLVDVPGDS